MSASAKKAMAEAAARGFTLMKNGEKIVYFGPLEAMTEDLAASLRAHRAELLRVLPAETEKAGQVFTHYGAGYQHPDGRVETGTPEPMPLPAEPWPDDLEAMLRRVATAYEWLPADRVDFIAWARRSPEGLADARQFLQDECAKLPAPSLTDRPRVALGR